MKTTTREESLKAALAALSGRSAPADVLLGRLCEIRRECAPKWERFKAEASAQMNLSADAVAAIVNYVEGR